MKEEGNIEIDKKTLNIECIFNKNGKGIQDLIEDTFRTYIENIEIN